MYDIEIYETINGKSEVKEYIISLQEKTNKDKKIKFEKTIAYIRLLKEKGLGLGQPYIKHISEEIWELRPLRNRILFASYIDNKFVLLSIFMKQTRKTPKKKLKKHKSI